MINDIEQKINAFLNNFPFVKKIVKRIYQLLIYSVSPKIKKEGNIVKLSPNDSFEYFYGYYDSSPWDSTGRYVLSLKVKDTTKDVAPKERAEIVLIDTKNNNKVKTIGTTNTWNLQQGSMLRWLGPNFNEKIIYNDFIDNKYCSVIHNIVTKEKTYLDFPIYDVSNDGKFAISLDFSRLHSLRPGYGYSNLKDDTSGIGVPNEACMWHIDIENNKVTELLTYSDLINFEPRLDMKNAFHKINHIMINPSGNRLMFLHRWKNNNQRFTRLLTMNSDGSDIYNLSDDNMSSHSYWKSDFEILSFAHKNKFGNGYFLMKDKTQEFEHLWPSLKGDGHPSFSPKGDLIVTDSYPNRSRLSSLYLIEDNKISTIARVYSPFKYDNDFRCDLHPRWSRDGTKVCFDSVYEGKRGLYYVDISK